RGRVPARDLRDAPGGGQGRRARRAPRRHRAALAGVRESRHVPRLQPSRRGVRASGAGAGGMSSVAHSSLLGFARSGRGGGGVHFDLVTIALTLIGGACAALLFSIPTPLLERASGPLLALAITLLGLVLIPGLGHAVNGSRRWLRLADINFQVSELSRMLVLVYLASYAVRREAELRESFTGLGKPLVLLVGASALLLAEPDFGAATVLFATGFALLFLAGARLRYVIATTALAGAGFAVLAVSSSYRLRRLTAFLDPWA